MHHVTPAPQTLGTRSRLPAAALTGLTLVGLAALSACSAGVTDPPTSAGASQASSTEAAQPETSRSSEPQEQQTASEELVALTSEQMMDVLISPSDLSAVPEGHSTHSGSNYFHEEIAVEFQDYRDRFGTSECTTTMDSINVDLVGEGAEDGLMHMYSFTSSDGEEQTGLLYVWMLAYDRPINTSPVWSAVGEHCTGTQLQNGADSVDVATFDAGDFTGVQLGIHGDSEEFTTFSASVDAGENLVMMSSVGLGEERFRDVVRTQQLKLDEFDRTQLDQAQG